MKDWYKGMDIKEEIIVYQATHSKKCDYKVSYMVPIQVGAILNEVKIEDITDDIGINISNKNKQYCELTALYWAWKNSKTDIIGLCHYRRIFPFKSKEEIVNILENYDIIVASPYSFRISLEDEYLTSHIKEDYNALIDVIKTYYYEMYESAIRVLKRNILYPYNMIIMNKEQLDNYCNWLFDILDKVERNTYIKERNNYQNRYIGFLAERLLTIYIIHNKFNVYESSIIYENKRYARKIRKVSWMNQLIFRLKWSIKYGINGEAY